MRARTATYEMLLPSSGEPQAKPIARVAKPWKLPRTPGNRPCLGPITVDRALPFRSPPGRSSPTSSRCRKTPENAGRDRPLRPRRADVYHVNRIAKHDRRKEKIHELIAERPPPDRSNDLRSGGWHQTDRWERLCALETLNRFGFSQMLRLLMLSGHDEPQVRLSN